MYNRIIIYFICLASIVFSCKEDKNPGEIIKINPFEVKEDINLSDIVDSVKYIKLQTDSNCVMGRVKEIIIKEKYIYALDVSQGIIFVFDKKGKYISKLDKRGKGPGEYLNLGPFFVDDNEEFVEIINSIGKDSELFKYSNISFNLLEKRPMPRIFANSCKEEGDTYYFAAQQIDNIFNEKSTNASVLIVKNNKIVKTLFDKNINTSHANFSPNTECFTKNDYHELFVSIMYDNSFYQLIDMNAYPIFTVDFGKYGIDNSIGVKSIKEQLRYLETTSGLASFPVLNINNSNIMSFSYFFKQSGTKSDLHQYIRLKNSNKTFHTKKIKNDITDFPDELHISTYYWGIGHEVWHKDRLLDIILPSYYFKNGETKKTVEGLGEITIEDNPIIVMLKLKEELK